MGAQETPALSGAPYLPVRAPFGGRCASPRLASLRPRGTRLRCARRGQAFGVRRRLRAPLSSFSFCCGFSGFGPVSLLAVFCGFFCSFFPFFGRGCFCGWLSGRACGSALCSLFFWLGGCRFLLLFARCPGLCPLCGWGGRPLLRPAWAVGFCARCSGCWGGAVLGGFASVGFSGSRSLSGSAWSACAGLALAAVAAGCSVLVGCASGADAAARAGAGPLASVFSARASRFSGLPFRSALAARSAWFVRSLAAAPAPVLVSFPGRACPSRCRVGRSWSSCGSGSWSSLALAVGLGVPVFVFLPAGVAPPAGWGSWSLVAAGPFAGAWSLATAVQPSLF